MFVASCGGGAGTNPFDNAADSNTATTDETSYNNIGTTDNTDGSENSDTPENTLTSISFGSATPPDGNSVVNVTPENNSIIRTFGGAGDVRYAVENRNEVFISTISGLMAPQVIRTRRSQISVVLAHKMSMPHHSPSLTLKILKAFRKTGLLRLRKRQHRALLGMSSFTMCSMSPTR